MEDIIHERERFESIDWSGQAVPKQEFYKCTFVKCDFRKSDLGDVDFDECIFEECDMTMAALKNTGLREVSFSRCKVLGVDFSVCNGFRFSVGFRGCMLDYSVFHNLKMPGTGFTDCTLKNVEFAEADLSSAAFTDCDLTDAGFFRTNLEKADFRTARNYRIDPGENRLKKARFSYPALAGLLDKYGIEIE